MNIAQLMDKNALAINQLKLVYSEIAQRMLERLDYTRLNPKMILDIGSGLNLDGVNLIGKYPKAKLVQLDCSLNMLKHYSLVKNSFLKRVLKYRHPALICADANQLPITSQTIDLVWSNLVLPYITNYEKFFKEIRRILTLGGAFFISGLGVDSLIQLREVGLKTHNFPDMHIIGDILVKLGFSDPVTDVEYLTLEYDDFKHLLMETKLVGCGSILNTTQQYLNKDAFFALEQKFAKLTQNGAIPLTLEIFYAHAWKDKVIVDLPQDKQIVQFKPNIKTS